MVKILHLPTSVGCYGYSMANAERIAGLDSHSLIIDNNGFGFPCDEQICVTARLSSLRKRKELVKEIRVQYDILHFNFGTSVIDLRRFGINLRDLKMYEGFCKVVVSFNGSDLRNWDHRKVNPNTPYRSDHTVSGFLKDRLKRYRAKIWMRHVSHAFVSTPDLLQFLPEEKCSYLPGVKENVRNISPVLYDEHAEPFRIVHAPSNRKLKGTQVLVDAVKSLQRDGVPVELLLVEGVTNREAIELYKKAHLIVDQLLIGWYGGFAIESLALGKPVMAYINDDTLARVDAEMRKDVVDTFVSTEPARVKDDLLKAIGNRSSLAEKAGKGPEFVSTWHCPDKAIRPVIEIYESILNSGSMR